MRKGDSHFFYLLMGRVNPTIEQSSANLQKKFPESKNDTAFDEYRFSTHSRVTPPSEDDARQAVSVSDKASR